MVESNLTTIAGSSGARGRDLADLILAAYAGQDAPPGARLPTE